LQGDALLFSSGHFLRVLAGRWIGSGPTVYATSFMLDTGSLSALGYEHDFSQPVVRLWNDANHVSQELEQKPEEHSALALSSAQK
jgi:broad specificity phosphatase PhoE